VKVLKSLITSGINSQELYTQDMIARQLSHAVATFSQDVAAKFNFMDVALQDHLLTANNRYLVKFLTCVIDFFSKSMSIHSAFDCATKILSERFIDSFYLHLHRAGSTIPPAKLTTVIHEQLGKLDTDIRRYIPCSATKTYEGMEAPVCCESSQYSHGGVHQSSQTYMAAQKEGGLAKVFGLEKKVPQACRWEGIMQVSTKYDAVGWFVDPTLLNKPPATVSAFMSVHRQVLESQKHILSNLQMHQLCLACLLSGCMEVLECGHMLCTRCCQELLVNDVIECPFCHEKGEWRFEDIPPCAGIRILSIDGVGVQGLSTALLLQKIEEQLRISIHHLFDLVVGRATGAISALGYGALHQLGNQVAAFQKALQEVVESPMLDPLIHSEFYPDVRLFVGSRLPRIAVAVDSSAQINYSYYAGIADYDGTVKKIATNALLKSINSTTIPGINPYIFGLSEAQFLWDQDRIDVLLALGILFFFFFFFAYLHVQKNLAKHGMY
jgi:hypothetical protein